jgi:hypothetical protein
MPVRVWQQADARERARHQRIAGEGGFQPLEAVLGRCLADPLVARRGQHDAIGADDDEPIELVTFEHRGEVRAQRGEFRRGDKRGLRRRGVGSSL